MSESKETPGGIITPKNTNGGDLGLPKPKDAPMADRGESKLEDIQEKNEEAKLKWIKKGGKLVASD
jgi:hypothetical protein